MKKMYKDYYSNKGVIKYKNKSVNYKDILVMSLEEFGKKNDIHKNNKTKDIRKVFEQYGLDFDFIINKEYDNNRYEIPKLSQDILTLMIKNSKNNKFKNKEQENINMKDFIEYNNKVFELIDDLPISLQNEIKREKIYEKNLEINQLLEMLSDRINLFLNIFLENQDIDSGVTKIKKLITYIDKLLYDYANSEKIKEENLKGIHSTYYKKQKRENNIENYMLEIVFRKIFLNSIKRNIEVLDYLQEKEIPLIEIQDKLNKISEKFPNENSMQVFFETEVLNVDYDEYGKKLLEEYKNICNRDEKIKQFSEQNKYFFNDISCKNVIKGIYEEKKEDILNVIFSFDKYQNDDIFLQEYHQYWNDSILNEVKLIGDYVAKFGYNINYNKSITKLERCDLVKSWNDFIDFLEYEVILKLEKYSLIEYSGYELDQLEKINMDNYLKWKNEYYIEENNKRNFIEYLDKKVYSYVDNIKEYNDDVLNILKEKYNDIDKRRKRRYKTIKQIISINKKIEKEEKELLQVKNIKNIEKRKELKCIYINNKKQLEAQRYKLTKKLSNINDLKNSVYNMLGKMIINILYIDRDYMKENKVDLKAYIRILDKNNYDMNSTINRI